MPALNALLIEQKKTRTWEAYMADMSWVCASKFQKKFPVKRYSALIAASTQKEERSGMEILRDIKDRLRKRKGAMQ